MSALCIVTINFVCVAYRKFLLVDPTDKEEKVMDGKMVIGMNKHREICTLQVSGEMLLLKDQVLDGYMQIILALFMCKISCMLKYRIQNISLILYVYISYTIDIYN